MMRRPPKQSRGYLLIALTVLMGLATLLLCSYLINSRSGKETVDPVTARLEADWSRHSVLHGRNDLAVGSRAKSETVNSKLASMARKAQPLPKLLVTKTPEVKGSKVGQGAKLEDTTPSPPSPPMLSPPPVVVSSGVLARLASLKHEAGHSTDVRDDLLKNGIKKAAPPPPAPSPPLTGADASGQNTLQNVTTGQEPAKNVTTGQEPAKNVTTGQEPAKNVTTGQEPAKNATTGQEPAKTKSKVKGIDPNVVDEDAAIPEDAAKEIAAKEKRPADVIARTEAFDALNYSRAMGQPGDTMHVMFTSNGSPYQNFQARIMVATWRIAQKLPGGEKMVAMTRILHRTKGDELMNEIDTFRADPLQPECDTWCWFPVADRANAVQQWIDAAAVNSSLIKAPWLLLLETDYVWAKPLMAPGSAYDISVSGLSFGFGYIYTGHPLVKKMLEERCSDCSVDSVPDSGPAPVLARYSDFRANTPIWEELSLYIETHEQVKKSLGWVREMYAWDVGVAANKLNITNLPAPASTLISQPPHDQTIGNASMYHYTWGSLYQDAEHKDLWKFDKRFYTAADDALKVPLLAMPPKWHSGIKLIEGAPVSEQLHNTLTHMISLMNEGIKTLPDLRPNKQ